METGMTAMLVDDPMDVGGRPEGVTATIAREEIEEALASDEPLDLFLDVRRPKNGGVETTDVRVNWQRSDLESLLARMDSDAVILSFDRAKLERVLDDPDFEGHGFREAILLTVAAASASAAVAAGTASGQLMPADGGGAAAAAIVAPGHGEAGTAGILAAPAHDEATLAARGVDVGIATAITAHDEATTARDVAAPAIHDETSPAARGLGVTVVPGPDETTLAARGIESQPVAAAHDEATLSARGIEGAPAPVDSGTSFELPSVDPGTAAAIGGLAGAGLIIAAAAFAVRRNRMGTA